MQTAKSGSHTIWDCKYHTVWVTKYRYATAYYNRGNARLDAGDKDGAAADYREAARFNPALKPATEMLQKVGMKM